jgi:aminoglycoside phosphotransferase (APT) family kinase protein
MNLFTSGKRELEGLAPRLEQWLREADPQYADMKVVSFRPASDSAGQSNETYTLRLASEKDPAAEQALILRTAPSIKKAYFPNSINKQYRIMTALGRNTDLPMPTCPLYEAETQLFGSAFFLMHRIEGMVPGDTPCYVDEGFVFDATPAQQAQLWNETVKRIADVGRLNIRRAGLEFMSWPDPGRSAIHQHLDHWEAYYNWAKTATDGFPHMEKIQDWLRAHAPRDEPVGLIWGDSRLGNVIYADFQPVALLDWEMAQIGNPIADLAYLLMSDAIQTERSNRGERIAGFPGDAASIALYERASGLSTEHLAYYMVFNLYKVSAIGQRVESIFTQAGDQTAVTELSKHRQEMVDEIFNAMDRVS